MKALDRDQLVRVFGRIRLVDLPRTTSTRSPVPAILGSLAVGAALAIALLLGPASGGSEPVITGSVLFAFGFGWGLMAVLSNRFSAQPQTWTIVPAAFLGLVGIGLVMLQPGPAGMDLLGWIWPPALLLLAIWMVRQIRSQLHGRGRWLVVPVVATLIVSAVGGALVTVSSNGRSDTAARSGQLVDVGGRRLYIECTGSGGPTVVLQAGLGGTSSAWSLIAPVIAARTKVCVYDRAGHGRSDEAGPQDGIALATDLHTLLQRAGVAGPYVLAGHSSGGAYVRVFTARYPDEVVGMVLLDAQPADVFTAIPDYPSFYRMYRLVTTWAPSLARIGVLGPLLGLSPDESKVETARAQRDEVAALPAALDQAAALTTLGDRPLVVVTAGIGAQAGWPAAQDRLAGLSTDSAHRVVAAATHDSLITGLDAPISAGAILDVVEAVRTGTPLR